MDCGARDRRVRAHRRAALLAGFFSYFNDDPKNIRNIVDCGGGGLMDIGCYLVHASRMIFEREPVRAAAMMERDPKMDIDRLTSVMLDFGGPQAIGACSTQLVPYQRIQIIGHSRAHRDSHPLQRAARPTHCGFS